MILSAYCITSWCVPRGHHHSFRLFCIASWCVPRGHNHLYSFIYHASWCVPRGLFIVKKLFCRHFGLCLDTTLYDCKLLGFYPGGRREECRYGTIRIALANEEMFRLSASIELNVLLSDIEVFWKLYLSSPKVCLDTVRIIPDIVFLYFSELLLAKIRALRLGPGRVSGQHP